MPTFREVVAEESRARQRARVKAQRKFANEIALLDELAIDATALKRKLAKVKLGVYQQGVRQLGEVSNGFDSLQEFQNSIRRFRQVLEREE